MHLDPPAAPDHASASKGGTEPDQRSIIVFLRDVERDLGFGYKTTGAWTAGTFDPSPWREGDLCCDCARGPLLYESEAFPCGKSRFLVERIVVWDTGEVVYSEADSR